MDDEDRSFGSRPGARRPLRRRLRRRRCSRGGAIPTAKHFPGLGDARLNTDSAVQRIELSRRALRRLDEARLRRRSSTGRRRRGRMVMMSSAVYPAFSERPAAFSRSLATVELRGRLGFRGVSITDALETASTAAFGGPARAAKLAARAGTDLLLFAGLDAAERAAKPLRRAARPRALARALPRVDRADPRAAGDGGRPRGQGRCGFGRSLSGFLSRSAKAAAPSKVRCRPSGWNQPEWPEL